MNAKFITVKEIAKKYGLSYQTVNRYCDAGLISFVMKKGNIRYYDRGKTERRMKQIAQLSGEGYSMMLIRRKLVGI